MMGFGCLVRVGLCPGATVLEMMGSHLCTHQMLTVGRPGQARQYAELFLRTPEVSIPNFR
jgi:hypothetical protein